MYPYQYNSLIQSQNAYEQNLKNIINQANGQLQQLQQMQNPMQIPQQPTQPSINQTFQLSPTNQGSIKYINNEQDLAKEIVTIDTLFVNNQFTNLWLKKVNGEIKKYQLEEIIPIDEKDIKIQELEDKIKEMIDIQNKQLDNNNDNNNNNNNNNFTISNSTNKSSVKPINIKNKK